MSDQAPEELAARHEAFLACSPVDRPLVGFWVGGYYPGEQFPHGTADWREGQYLDAVDVPFARFREDYQNLYAAHRDVDDDFFYIGSAYWGIPWMEAILGCPIAVARANCVAETCPGGLARVPERPTELRRNPWFQALLRFTQELVEFAGDRFPVCPPLLRGPGDCASAMLGGASLVLGLMEDPAQMQGVLQYCSGMRLAVLQELLAAIPAWHGGWAAGGYPSKVWSREPVAYHQDDSAALLDPDLFRRFLLPLHEQQCRATAVNFVHLHSSCLYPVDILLESPCYDVLEINIDHPGGSSPSLVELLPVCRRIQTAGRPLLLWGGLAVTDWRRLCAELSPVGLSLQPMVRAPSDAPEIRRVLR